jgi:hypothetical protein
VSACRRVGPKGQRSLAQALAWVASYNALGLKDREKPQTLRLPAWEREPSTGIFRIALSCSKRFGSGSATPPIQSSPPRKKMSFRSFDRFFMHSINLSRWCSACSSRHRGSLPWLQPFAGGEELVFSFFRRGSILSLRQLTVKCGTISLSLICDSRVI